MLRGVHWILTKCQENKQCLWNIMESFSTYWLQWDQMIFGIDFIILRKKILRNGCITISWYIRKRSFTTSSVSSARVTSFDLHCVGGGSGAINIPGLPFSPLTFMEATLKFFPHWLQILLPRHFASSTSSLSLRFTTRSMSVTPSNISWQIRIHENKHREYCNSSRPCIRIPSCY